MDLVQFRGKRHECRSHDEAMVCFPERVSKKASYSYLFHLYIIVEVITVSDIITVMLETCVVYILTLSPFLYG